MWVNGQRMEEVGLDVPTTNMLKKPSALPAAPQNLGFDPNRPKYAREKPQPSLNAFLSSS